MHAALLSRRVAGGCRRVWCGIPRPLVHIRSASVAEPGTGRSDEDQLWEAASYLPFSRARIGSFFQERPVLRNPFLEDALLRGYLSRHLPQEVRKEHSCTQIWFGYCLFSAKSTGICDRLSKQLDRISLVR